MLKPSILLVAISFAQVVIGQSNADVSQLAYAHRYVTGADYLDVRLLDVTSDEDKTQLVIDLQWDASWRDSESHDASWVFVKARDPGGDWKHVKLKPRTMM